MQKKFLEGFKQFDAFGALYQTNVTPQQKEYRTLIGALITLIIYGISLAFLLYNLIQWQSGELIPKVIATNAVYTEYNFTYSDVLFTLSGDPRINIASKETNNQDPFDPQQLIFQPTFLININGAPFKQIDLELIKNNETQLYNFQFKNITFRYSQKSSEQSPSIDFWVSLGACINSTLPSGMFCASQDKIDSFLNQTMKYIVSTIRIKQYNTNTRKSESIDNSQYIVIDQENTYFGQMLLSVQSTTVDDGFLFPSYNTESYISSMQTSSQQISGKSMYSFFQKDMYIGLEVQISPIISEQFVQFPKFNEILADTGSMVSIIFYISILAKLINEKFQNLDVIQQVISFYYPKFKHIRMQYNWRGQLSKVFYQEKLLNKKKFLVHYEKLSQIARQKLSLSNQLYEISRLQFIIQSLQSRNCIQQSHNIGIPLQNFMDCPKNFESKNPIMNLIIQSNDEKLEKVIQKVDPDESLELKHKSLLDVKLQGINQLQENLSYQLTDDDFGLLILNEKQNPIINDCQTNFIEFYKQNQIE